jgi:hypothetical protein
MDQNQLQGVGTSNSVDTIPKGHSPRTISATVGQCKQPGVTDIRWKEILNWNRLYERWITYPVDKSYQMDKSSIQWI